MCIFKRRLTNIPSEHSANWDNESHGWHVKILFVYFINAVSEESLTT